MAPRQLRKTPPLSPRRRRSFKIRISFITQMEGSNHDLVVGIPLAPVTFAAEELPATATSKAGLASQFFRTSSCRPSLGKQKKEVVVEWISKLEDIREHVTLGPKISDTMKGKLSMGARILQAGGVERVFRKAFSVREGERLLKAFQCYLSTTAGPISGMLFISTNKIAFRSNRSLELTSAKGFLVRVPYKVLIPLRRVKEVTQSENKSKPRQKYVQIVTKDEFEFWFMGFVNSESSFKYLQQAISASQ